MIDKIDEWLKKLGINSFDELDRPGEKDQYFKLLEIAEKGKITLDDVKKHIHSMRQAVEFALATEKLGKNEDLFLKARLKNYILLESLFERPERAKDMIESYTKTKGGGINV